MPGLGGENHNREGSFRTRTGGRAEGLGSAPFIDFVYRNLYKQPSADNTTVEAVHRYVILAAVFLFFLTACTNGPAVICNKPYMLVGSECCLDSNDNGICDSDDGILKAANGTLECPEMDCSLCPATIVEKEVEVPVTKYVCDKSGEEVDDPSKCEGNKAYNPFERYKPYTGAEARSVIEQFVLRPACRDSIHAIEVHFVTGSLPGNVTIQVKERPADDWKDIFTLESTTLDKYFYGAFCLNICTSNAEFFLAPDKVYLLRAEFDYTRLFDEMQYSNEYIVDVRENGEYLTKFC